MRMLPFEAPLDRDDLLVQLVLGAVELGLALQFRFLDLAHAHPVHSIVQALFPFQALHLFNGHVRRDIPVPRRHRLAAQRAGRLRTGARHRTRGGPSMWGEVGDDDL